MRHQNPTLGPPRFGIVFGSEFPGKCRQMINVHCPNGGARDTLAYSHGHTTYNQLSTVRRSSSWNVETDRPRFIKADLEANALYLRHNLCLPRGCECVVGIKY
ncbi:unnamed protein product [Pieris brassicae]|uniref:Uncharacterized protein n=1 Tax=Pieris brassicae TaxID=7116 RepID=A0A9P0T3P5_PIEBR|nr:unnamed protein product [Pieris brassicae]